MHHPDSASAAPAARVTRAQFLRGLAASALSAPFIARQSWCASPDHNAAPIAAAGNPPGVANVRDFGAKGDGVSKDHAAIQRAIDRCAEWGGGTAWVPPGRYLCGTLVLKSHVRLYLDAGATIAGSPDQEDYRRMREGNHFYRSVPTQPVNHDQNLIVVWKATDASIEGPGTIDARGESFYQLDKGLVPNGRRMSLLPKSWRPGAMIACMHSQGFSLSQVTLRGSPFLNVLLFGSSEIRIQGIRIQGDHRFQTCDGIHTKACRDITISDCQIDAEDDCLSFYTNSWGLPDDGPDTSHVTVNNCRLSSSCCGVRIGYAGPGQLSSMVFNNIVIKRANRGIDFICGAFNHYQGQPCAPGPSLHDLLFSNFVIEDSNWGVSANICHDAVAPGGIRDVHYSGMKVRSRRGNYLVGSTSLALRDVSFRDVDFTVTGQVKNAPATIPEPLPMYFGGELPCGLLLRHATRVALRDCSIRWDGAEGPWRTGLHVVDGRAIDCRTLRVEPLRDDWESGITRVASDVAMPPIVP